MKQKVHKLYLKDCSSCHVLAAATFKGQTLAQKDLFILQDVQN